MPLDPFDIAGKTLKPVVEARSEAEVDHWWRKLLDEAKARKAEASQQKALTSNEIEELARQVFGEMREKAFVDAGVSLPDGYLMRLIGELSGIGILMELISRSDIEDIAINLSHIYVYVTGQGWQHAGKAPESTGDAIRVLIDRAGQRSPTPDYPIADAMLQIMTPTADGQTRRKGVRINYIMPPASPYGDVITLRVSNYRTAADLERGSLAQLCQSRLPPVTAPKFEPRPFGNGNGVLTPEAANYLLSVMVRGGTLVIAGATGSGKTYFGQRLLQEMLDFFPRGAIRLFIVEDSNEIILNGWNGDPDNDTGNVIYTVTRPEIRGGPPPVTMYDLIRAALRSRPHGVVIGEARGAEAWELIRAAATGHGHSAFTIHATGAEYVWARFVQVVQAHPDVQRMNETQIAQAFAEAVSAICYIERSPQYGQIMREVYEVSPVVERAAARPSISPLFRFDPSVGRLMPTGNRPMRPGFTAGDLGLAESFFRRN